MTLVATVASLMTAAEKAAALETYSRTLRRILIRESPNVIPFRRDAALPLASPAADSQPPNRGRTLYTDEP